MKKCTKCGNTKPRTKKFFHKDNHNHDGFCSRCTVCESARRTERGRGHAYKLTKKQVHKMYVSQKHACAICGRREEDIKGILEIDHCHKTGCVRGLLCRKCNLLLGLADDNIKILQDAIEYLLV